MYYTTFAVSFGNNQPKGNNKGGQPSELPYTNSIAKIALSFVFSKF